MPNIKGITNDLNSLQDTKLDRINTIINGNFDFWQRGTSFSANGYTADRFQLGGLNPDFTLARDTDVPTVVESGFQSTYSLKATYTSAYPTPGGGQFSRITYKVEGYNVTPLLEKKATFKFWVKSNITGTYSIGLRSAANDRSYVTEYVIDSADTWEEKEITVDMAGAAASGTWNFTNGTGLRIDFVLMEGGDQSTSTIDEWQDANLFSSTNQVNLAASTSNYLNIAQIQLVESEEAASFQRAGRNIQEELAMCQRYYEKSWSVDFAPGSGNEGGQDYMANTSGPHLKTGGIAFKVTKRVDPTMKIYRGGTVVNSFTARTIASAAANLAAEYIEINGESFSLGNNSGSHGNDAKLANFAWTADAEL